MESCNCEHRDHFTEDTVHEYLGVPAGTKTMMFVGRVCDECKSTCEPDMGAWK